MKILTPRAAMAAILSALPTFDVRPLERVTPSLSLFGGTQRVPIITFDRKAICAMVGYEVPRPEKRTNSGGLRYDQVQRAKARKTTPHVNYQKQLKEAA